LDIVVTTAVVIVRIIEIFQVGILCRSRILSLVRALTLRRLFGRLRVTEFVQFLELDGLVEACSIAVPA
jgi:hypothetical protein